MRFVAFTLLAATATACGDNRDGSVPADASPISDVPPESSTAVIVAGDFTPGDPGVMSVVDTTTLQMRTNVAPAGAVDSDPVLRKFGDELFVVNRNDNNVTILKASDFSLVEQIGTGAGSNPQDVAIMGDKLYVPVYGGTGIVVLTRGSTAVTPIDLSMDDPGTDNKPRCSSIFRVDDSIYVACQLLDDGFAATVPGKIYVLDAAGALQASKTMTLTTKNPLSLIERVPAGGPSAGDLVVGTVDFATNMGCVEQITPGATPAYVGCLPTNTDLGGYANRIDFAKLDSGDTLMWLAVAEAFPHASWHGFDMMTKQLWAGALSPASQQIIEAVACPDGSIVMSDNTSGATGVRVYYSTTEQTTTPLSTGVAFAAQHGIACY